MLSQPTSYNTTKATIKCYINKIPTLKQGEDSSLKLKCDNAVQKLKLSLMKLPAIERFISPLTINVNVLYHPYVQDS